MSLCFSLSMTMTMITRSVGSLFSVRKALTFPGPCTVIPCKANMCTSHRKELSQYSCANSFLEMEMCWCSCLCLCLWCACTVLCCVAGRVSCRVVSCRVVSCRVVSCRVVSCRVVSCRVVSCRVVLFVCSCVLDCHRCVAGRVPAV